MRKLLLIVAAFAAGCAFADRTANRDWVGRNFAPSNLVPRVEALEGEVPPVESVNGRTGEVVLVAGDLNAYTKTEADAAITGKLDRIVRDSRYAYNHSEFKQTLDGLEYIEYQTEDGETEVIGRASLGDKMVYATEDANWLTAGIHASEDYLGFGISQSASAFRNGSFSIFYGNGFISIGNNEIEIPNATGTMALRSTTLAGYGIGDAYTKTQTDAAIAAKVETDPLFTTWTNGVTVAVGKGATVTNHGATAVGPYATAKGMYAVAIGCESWAQGEYAVQLGSGYNRNPGTLQFGEWTLLDANGKIPSGRLPADGGSIPRSSEEAIDVGPLVLGLDNVYFAPGVCGMNGPAWKRTSWKLDSSCVYTSSDWNFCDTLWIGFDGIWLERDDLLHFKSGSGYLSVDEKVKAVMTPAVVLQQIKAMNATQKAELKAFLGIQ